MDTIEAALARIERHLDLGVKRDAYTVRRACNTGRIKAMNGRDWRIPHEELMRVEAEGVGR